MRIYQGAFSIGDDDLVIVSRKKRTDRNGYDATQAWQIVRAVAARVDPKLTVSPH